MIFSSRHKYIAERTENKAQPTFLSPDDQPREKVFGKIVVFERRPVFEAVEKAGDQAYALGHGAVEQFVHAVGKHQRVVVRVAPGRAFEIEITLVVIGAVNERGQRVRDME